MSEAKIKCFVIMPFGNPSIDPEHKKRLDHIYSEWIKPTVESVSISAYGVKTITCHRGDKENRPGEIIDHILEHLILADIVIADLSGKNPNVFYELGVRHAVKKNTILIADNIADIPFDLRGQRAIPYQYDPIRLVEFRELLKATICNVITTDIQIDNPVRQFLYNKEIERISTASTPPGYDIVVTILSEMATMKSAFETQMGDMKKMIQDMIPLDVHNKTRVNIDENDLSFLEGAWRAFPSGSRLYAKIINGKLLAPYCYSGNSELTAHYYDFHRLGNTIIARFKWFRTDFGLDNERIDYEGFNIEGYTILNIESPEKLVGGWWYGNYQPLESISLMNQMTSITLLKENKTKKFPIWAEEYFKKVSFTMQKIIG